MAKTKKLGVVVGRFQLPTLHPGHVELISHVAAHHERVLVVCGYNQKWPMVADVTREPYPVAMQQQIVQASFPDVLVSQIPDSGGFPRMWSEWLDTLVTVAACGDGAVLYGSRDSFIMQYSGTYEVVEIESHGEYSATAVRDSLAGVLIDDPMFRQGWLAAVQHIRSLSQ